MVKALLSAADGIILDLEDSVSFEHKSQARAALTSFLASAARTKSVFVRINQLASGITETDLEAILAHPPDGIVLPKAEGKQTIAQLDEKLNEFGFSNMLVLPIATETPSAIFEIGTYRDVNERLIGLTWGAEDLPAVIGASSARETNGRFTPPYELARSLTLFAAHAAGAAAIETVYPNFKDLDGLKSFAVRAASDGFSGMMAIHPSQISTINDAFTPSDEVMKRAYAIVDAFAANPGAGVLAVRGEMIDGPHLKQAKRLIAAAV
jgi:citrate lyase subunit beta / citryl-CoA lyase